MSEDLYAKLGVDSGKSSVRTAFGRIIQNEFPGAWVNIVRHLLLPGHVVTQHNDGDGSKFIQRLLHYLETADASVLKGAVDDALTMNGADIAASGFVYGVWFITDVLNLSLPAGLKSVVMQAVAKRFEELFALYEKHGLKLAFFLGGETADLPDQVRSAVFDVCINAQMPEQYVIKGDVRPGDAIYGLSSGGRASWETVDNSGIMANGLTLARPTLMSDEYDAKYPNLKRNGVFFKGRFKVGDRPDGLGMEVSEALMSPTRQWAIFIRMFMDALAREDASDLLHGISVNTGGGSTKIKNLGAGGIRYSKHMPMALPIFDLIQSESGQPWEHMHSTFNCGIGLDIVGSPERIFQRILAETAADAKIRLCKLGSCAACDGKNKVVLETSEGTYDYD